MDKRNRRQAEAGEFNHGWSWMAMGERKERRTETTTDGH
jgi:hypothetical protein